MIEDECLERILHTLRFATDYAAFSQTCKWWHGIAQQNADREWTVKGSKVAVALYPLLGVHHGPVQMYAVQNRAIVRVFCQTRHQFQRLWGDGNGCDDVWIRMSKNLQLIGLYRSDFTPVIHFKLKYVTAFHVRGVGHFRFDFPVLPAWPILRNWDRFQNLVDYFQSKISLRQICFTCHDMSALNAVKSVTQIPQVALLCEAFIDAS